jgi:hypothetical protein
MKVTRRSLAGILAAPALMSKEAAAQAPAATPELNSAKTDFQSAARQIAEVKLPRSVEPATRFEA